MKLKSTWARKKARRELKGVARGQERMRASLGQKVFVCQVLDELTSFSPCENGVRSLTMTN